MRFIPNENTWIGFKATIAGTVDGAKVADVTGAVDLTHFVTGLTASTTGQSVPTPSFDTLFETNIAGTASGSFSIDGYRDDDTDTLWDTLPRGTTGFIILSRWGGIPSTVGDPHEVWPIQVLSRSVPNMASSQVVTATVTAAVPSEPGEDSLTVA